MTARLSHLSEANQSSVFIQQAGISKLFTGGLLITFQIGFSNENS